MTKSSATTVNHHTDLALVINAHFLSGIVIVDLIHNLDLCIVVTGSQGPKLKEGKAKQGNIIYMSHFILKEISMFYTKNKTMYSR